MEMASRELGGCVPSGSRGASSESRTGSSREHCEDGTMQLRGEESRH
jgi:hypothetical protein